MATEKNTLIKDEQTAKRIHEHLRNESDLISEEDIKNVKTSIDEERFVDLTNTAEKSPEREEGIANDDAKNDDGEDPRIETSWNILK